MSCSCGSSCQCGSNCKCGKSAEWYSETTSAASETVVLGVAPQKTYFDESETVMSGGENGCKCGSSCTCDPCNCK